MSRWKSKRITFIRFCFTFFYPFIRSLTRFKRAVSNLWCFSATNRPKLNTPHRTTKTASYETSFFCSHFAWHCFSFSFHHQIDQIKVEIRFISLFFFFAVCFVFFSLFSSVFVAFWKEKSRFSIKFQTFWWKLSRFYCWKYMTTSTKRKEMKGKFAYSFDSAHKRICDAFSLRFLSVFRLKLGFFHRLCKFYENVSVIFSSQIHRHLSANLHVSKCTMLMLKC